MHATSHPHMFTHTFHDSEDVLAALAVPALKPPQASPVSTPPAPPPIPSPTPHAPPASFQLLCAANKASVSPPVKLAWNQISFENRGVAGEYVE